MELKGKLQIILPPVEGQGKNGPWKKQEFVIETLGDYPKSVCISTWGDKAEEVKKFNIGDTLICSLDISSREYNGRWYTEVRAWKIMADTESSGEHYVQFSDSEPSTDSKDGGEKKDWEGDLPF